MNAMQQSKDRQELQPKTKLRVRRSYHLQRDSQPRAKESQAIEEKDDRDGSVLHRNPLPGVKHFRLL
jgi:hypothetical protein